MKTLTLITLLAAMSYAHAMTPPPQYVCNTSLLGNCICKQTTTTAFPQTVKPLFICKNAKNIILHGATVTVSPSDGRTSVSYTINGDRQMMLVNSTVGLKPIVNRYWEKSDSVWMCGDAGLCQMSRK
jgi:hypothetical protein